MSSRPTDGATTTGDAELRLVRDQVAPLDASTIMVVRDGAAGLEVLMLERHLRSDFVGGALVFPGGKVDDADRTLPAGLWRGRDPAEWRARLGARHDADALGLMVAAVRETFEEANILLATRNGAAVTDALLTTPSFVEARRRLCSREERFDWRKWLADEHLVLDLAALAPWSWWVTPKGSHKRFDTRFFIARLPEGQSGASDEVETTDLRWTPASEALRAHEDGKAMVIFPTRRNLTALGAFDSAQAAWAAADAGKVDMRRIEPTIVQVDGKIMVQHPDEHTPDTI